MCQDRFHLEEQAEALAGGGLDARQARREAARRFGEPAGLAAEWRRAEGELAPSRWRWTLATTAGIVGGIGLGLPAGRWIDALLGMGLMLPAVGLVIGAALGASQSLVLGARRAWRWRWIAASALGLAAGLTSSTIVLKGLGLARGAPVPEGLALLILGAATGLAPALAQWHLARPARAGAARWIGSHALGGALGLLAGGWLAGPTLGGIETAAGLAVALALGAAGTGLAGSLCLAWLPRSAQA